MFEIRDYTYKKRKNFFWGFIFNAILAIIIGVFIILYPEILGMIIGAFLVLLGIQLIVIAVKVKRFFSKISNEINEIDN